MPKRRHLRHHSMVATADIVEALKARVVAKTGPLGHSMGQWTFAKKRFGAASQKALCVTCGDQAVVMPYHHYNKEHQQVPAITGDALFSKCKSPLPFSE